VAEAEEDIINTMVAVAAEDMEEADMEAAVTKDITEAEVGEEEVEINMEEVGEAAMAEIINMEMDNTVQVVQDKMEEVQISMAKHMIMK